MGIRLTLAIALATSLVAPRARAQESVQVQPPEEQTAPEGDDVSSGEEASGDLELAPPMADIAETTAAVSAAVAPVTMAILTEEGGALEVTIGGYVESGFTFQFAEPSNGVIAWRGFDNRHATFGLANVALRTRLDYDRIYAAITIQFGTTPDTYYLAEPASPAVAGVGASSADTWRFLQQAYAGWNIPLLGGIALEGGLFLSPVGIESMAIRENWNWSRSNLFYGCPFYHTGIRAHTLIAPDLTLSIGAYNGWNTVLDNNTGKSLSAAIDYLTDDFSVHFLYFTGIERADGTDAQWRHLFDAWASWNPTSWLGFMIHANAGFEPYTGMDAGWWLAGAFYARVEPVEWLAIAARVDAFMDRAPGDRPDLRIFWPTTPLMTSQTLTLQVTPDPHVSFFVEYRHDHTGGFGPPGTNAAARPSFFGGAVGVDPLTNMPIPNRFTQDTMTWGVTAGF